MTSSRGGAQRRRPDETPVGAQRRRPDETPLGAQRRRPDETPLAGRTILVTGASRGIGLAIAVRAARDGANVALLAKTDQPHPKLEGTVHTAAAAVEAAGGRALPIVGDVRDEAAVARAVEATVETLGGLDALVNNASAIDLSGTEALSLKRFDLMHDVNVRGTFVATQACLPHLRESSNPHVLTLSPPLNLAPRWLGAHVGYTLSKYGMTLAALGWAQELREAGIASNALWPASLVATAAIAHLGGEAALAGARRPEIVADAAHWILSQPARECTGRTWLDEEAVAEAGVADLSAYAVDPDGPPAERDLFLD